MNADEKLINNLKEQVDRLVEELKDLEACKYIKCSCVFRIQQTIKIDI